MSNVSVGDIANDTVEIMKFFAPQLVLMLGLFVGAKSMSFFLERIRIANAEKHYKEMQEQRRIKEENMPGITLLPQREYFSWDDEFHDYQCMWCRDTFDKPFVYCPACGGLNDHFGEPK